MRKKSLDQRIMEYLPFIDMPLLMLIGAAAGFLLMGTIMSAFAVFAGSDHTPWTRWLLAGLINIGLSVCVDGIAWIYWKLVLRKSGVIWPELSGFGLLLALMSLFSAAILGAQIIIK